jgi:hypothetical protein
MTRDCSESRPFLRGGRRLLFTGNIGHGDLCRYKLVLVPADPVMDRAIAKALRTLCGTCAEPAA